MHKLLSFWTFSWFVSVLICVVLEGSGVEAHGTRTIINQLSGGFNVSGVGGFFGLISTGLEFFNGLWRILIWDYSFYTGGWEILRWFWLVTLTPGIAWNIGSFMTEIAAALAQVF